MNLSKLVFLCVKNAIYYDDTSFSFDNFKRGLQDGNPDYSNNINNVYLPLNEAIARLSDLERIPYKVLEVNNIIDGVINLASIEQENNLKIKEVINVAILPRYVKIDHKNLGANKILINANFDTPRNLVVEVKEDIPYFDSSYYFYKKDNEDTLEEHDTDLRDYNINNSMCNYIMEYVMGKLTEQINPEIATMHITRAEAYFNNIRPNNSNLTQRVVEKIYGIED